MPKLSRQLILGVAVCLCAGVLAWRAAETDLGHRLLLSPLTIAIVAGMILGNAVPHSWLTRFHPGFKFSQQTLLRLGIVFYGIRLTLNDLWKLGPHALALDLIVITTVLTAGYFIGTRVLKMDQDTALLVSAGSGICGAAAVLATDRVIDSQSHKVSVAVATVVLFGTTAMFLYPFLYPHSGLTERQFGVYTGATVHEVAQALAAGRAVSQAASDTAVVTKMLRVLLLAPVLLLLSRLRRGQAGVTGKIKFPWFVFWFGAVIAVQSIVTIPAPARTGLIGFDTILLGAAMFALGCATRWQQMKQAGARPLILASMIFCGLVCGGWTLTRLLI